MCKNKSYCPTIVRLIATFIVTVLKNIIPYFLLYMEKQNLLYNITRNSLWAGTFNDLDHHQVAALTSCFVPGDRSSEQIHLRAELAKPLQQLQDSARRIAEVLWADIIFF